MNIIIWIFVSLLTYIIGLVVLFRSYTTFVASNIVFICFSFLVNPKWIQVKLNGDASNSNVLSFIGLAVGMSVLILILIIIVVILSCLFCRYMSSYSIYAITSILQ